MYSKVEATLASIRAWVKEHNVTVVTAKQPLPQCPYPHDMTPEEREELARRPICIDYIGVIGTP